MPRYRIKFEPGQQFGRLIVIASDPTRPAYWLCQCDCGVIRSFEGSSLKRGHARSCGCLKREIGGIRTRTHGEGSGRNKTAEYTTWAGMMQRCQNPRSQYWARYGGRGIYVDPRWQRFENFLADMGRRPSRQHSLDRLDNDGPYAVWNCRWATATEQRHNRRDVKTIEYRGRLMMPGEWAREAGLLESTLRARLRSGWTLEAALMTPARPIRRTTPKHDTP